MEQPPIKGDIIRQASMKRYTSMRVGGPISYLIYPRDEGDVTAAVTWLQSKGLPIRFLGNGTNLIVADRGMKIGLIRLTRVRHLRFIPGEHGDTAEAGGGLSLRELIKECSKRGYSGLEKLYGIPGTVGGAVKMNAGSFGVSVTDHLRSVMIMEPDGTIRTKETKELSFGYRSSSLKQDAGVLRATFELKKDDPGRIKANMDYVWGQRVLKHPMELPSAGSVFKNTQEMPCWKYIDLSGLRGHRIGGAAVCEKHANFIVNTGNATASDVRDLIDYVKRGVHEVMGVSLEEEVELLGFDVHKG
jgi:UDP-N-acetylmuramate dehydrogenase